MLNKNIISLCLIFGLLSTAPLSQADTSAAGGMGQLKTNSDNSEHNMKQYQANAQISQENVREISRAIIELDKTERQLMDNHANLEKNKEILKGVKEKISGFKSEEEEKMLAEKKQLEELLALVKKIQANQDRRQENIKAYELRMAEIDQEILDWDNQNRSMQQLKKQIAEKRIEAVKERSNWQSKRESYLAEAKKWQDELDSHRKTFQEYRHLMNN